MRSCTQIPFNSNLTFTHLFPSTSQATTASKQETIAGKKARTICLEIDCVSQCVCCHLCQPQVWALLAQVFTAVFTRGEVKVIMWQSATPDSRGNISYIHSSWLASHVPTGEAEHSGCASGSSGLHSRQPYSGWLHSKLHKLLHHYICIVSQLCHSLSIHSRTFWNFSKLVYDFGGWQVFINSFERGRHMRICNGVYIYVYVYMILITFVKNAYKEKNALVGKFIYHFF